MLSLFFFFKKIGRHQSGKRERERERRGERARESVTEKVVEKAATVSPPKSDILIFFPAKRKELVKNSLLLLFLK